MGCCQGCYSPGRPCMQGVFACQRKRKKKKCSHLVALVHAVMTNRKRGGQRVRLLASIKRAFPFFCDSAAHSVHPDTSRTSDRDENTHLSHTRALWISFIIPSRIHEHAQRTQVATIDYCIHIVIRCRIQGHLRLLRHEWQNLGQ